MYMNVPLPIIVSILGFVFSVLLLVIGILINVLNKNTEAINEMKIAIATQETADGYEANACKTRHEYVDKKLSKLSDTAQEHELRLVKLEAK